ncbi:MAG TPA: UDP-N-acetylglucosamine 1-carboxyvinyltransferase, partial [Clostridia bacterium]|nr:UDP-N-acetylglucosamine 1-carboxyvinyltransferase [Clostridia bacterium]
MDKITIVGGKQLRGRVRISGAKNAALALICACMLAQDKVVLENIPRIKDIQVVIEIIKNLGAKVSWLEEETLEILAPGELSSEAPYELVKQLRASNLLIGPLLARYGNVRVALPGGCNIGVRPMDLHFKGMSSLGAHITVKQGFVDGHSGKLVGARVYLDFPSVGATENIMMASCLAKGQTVIENVAKEPEIVDLANFLNSMGAKVRGAGTDIIKIEGVDELPGGVNYAVIPDRIEAGTFMVAAAATHSNVVLENVISRHLEPLSAKLTEANVQVEEINGTIRIDGRGEQKAIDIKTMPYPGFPTDMQSQMMSMLTAVNGTSIIVENIFENRFQVAAELKRMGAHIKVEG